MNKNETKAYNWLVGKGYTDIKFQRSTSPDFITSNGGFEVKTLDVNTIIFRKSQFDGLTQDKNNITVLVFNNESEPIAVIPFPELLTSHNKWHGIKIRVDKDRIIRNKSISITPEIFQRLKARHPRGYAMYGIIWELLDIADKYERQRDNRIANLHKRKEDK